jgi:hypothetical protein
MENDAIPQTETEEDELDNISLAEWIQMIYNGKTQTDDLDKTLDYTIFIEEQNSDSSD